MAGMPHFKDVGFSGAFPLAETTFSDNYFPGNITLNTFNPFENTTDSAMTYTACLSVGNREAYLTHHQHQVKEAGTSTLHITKLSSSNMQRMIHNLAILVWQQMHR
jgi:hypothetical protein